MVITEEQLKHTMTYDRYRNRIDQLLKEGKTTGMDHSSKMVEYTELNVHRMSRIERTVSVETDTRKVLEALNRKLIWIVFTEAWCGDAAQNLPVIAMMAQATPEINLHLLLRDEHPDLMDGYLTNGGRAIPKLVCLDAETMEELGTWGPRPETAQQMVREHKANPVEPYSEFVKKVQLWYAKDKGKSIQAEFRSLISHWEKLT